MKHVSVMIKPASSLCNLRCQYCFYADVSAQRAVPSHGVMTGDTCRAMIDNLFAELAEGDAVTIAFQGGEPTLAGLDYFRAFTAHVRAQGKKVRVAYALQTNGMLLDEEWAVFLRENHFLVGLSLDGYAEKHNQYRLDAQGKGTFAQVLAAKHLMDENRVEYNLLCTLTNDLARHPQKVWGFILEEDVRFIQFTPCLGGLDGAPDDWCLTPRRFHGFYAQLFPLWRQAVQKGNYVSVKLFDDIVNLFVRREVTACGLQGQCHLQNIVEADGSVYPCDFYVLDKYRGGNLAQEPLSAIQPRLEATGFLTNRQALPTACSACRYRQACQGGCKRLATAMCVDDAGFCGYRQLLDDIGEELCRVGRWLLSR